MTVELLRAVLGWSIVINYAVLLLWFVMFAFAHDWLYRLHGRWFAMPVERFNAIHYGGMAIYKIGIFLFSLAPYLALCLAGRSAS